MEIDRNNYEAYLLDLMEGNLSVEDQQKLRDFLKLNPDCALFHDLSEPWILEDEQVIFAGKEQLKKELPHASSVLTESNFDLFSIARMEGDLNETQKREHKSLVEHNQQKSLEWEQWQLTRLPLPHVEYRGKNELKNSGGIRSRVIWLSVISAAAAVALLFSLLRMEAPLPEIELTEETPEQVPPPEDQTPEILPKLTTTVEEEPASNDEPALFSIKKHPDRRVEPVHKNDTAGQGTKQDSLLLVLPRKLESRPLRLASYEVYGKDLGKESEYDQIKSLDIPASDIHLRSFSLAQIAEIDLQEAFDEYTEEKNLSLWSVANAGIKGINKLTGADISLLAAKDDEGDISGFRLKSKRFSFTRPLDRRE